MTAARRQRKPSTLFLVLSSALFLVFGGLFAGAPARAAVDDVRIVVNPQTGLALSGFDPVAYFVDHAPRFGHAAFELTLDGAIWRFQNEGNRAAFLDNPDVYTPRFGGYDPVAIGRGRSVPGHPLFFAVAGEGLYLFYSEADRDAFKADPGRVIDIAERRWPEVARTLGR